MVDRKHQLTNQLKRRESGKLEREIDFHQSARAEQKQKPRRQQPQPQQFVMHT